MKVLIACEESGIVRDAFLERGHDAWSCDILPSRYPTSRHLQCEVEEILEDGWDLMIAHPPCTYLSSSGLHWNKRVPGRDELTHQAMILVFALLDAPIAKIALENPVGCISTNYRKPDQIIQPYMFGHDASKSTCLWLKNLLPLRPTKFIEARHPGKNGRKVWGNQTPGGQNKLGPSPTRARDRAQTYEGIAQAMAEQWGKP